MCRPSRLVVLLLLVAVVPMGFAQDRTPGYDPATGRSAKRYAPDPQVDYRHLKLELSMPDPASRSFEVTETLDFQTRALPLESLRLDAVGQEIRSIKDAEGRDLEFRHDGREVIIRFPEPISPETQKTLIFEYTVRDPSAGITFAIPDEAYPDRPLHIHSQGQPEDNRHWIICHDFPNERMTTEILATVPANLKVLSNGEFQGQADAGEGMKRWHYTMTKPHVSYLVSLVVGEFDVVEDEWRGKRVSYWVPPGKADGVERTFSNTKNMLDFFSEKLGEYPWSAYSQSCVYLFGSGGMENTTVTTLYEDAVFDTEKAAVGNSMDGLIAHELAHQWFGDHTTCKTWAHLWLNEGFATFLDQAWHEHFHGPDEYAHKVYTNMRNVARSDDVTAPAGLYNPYYEDPWENFRRPVSNPYGKGSSVIHMLRQSVGNDEVFWEALRLFQNRHGLSEVEADELRMCFEELTGRDYEPFFRQWVYRPGAPHLDVRYAWNEAAGAVELNFTQTQPIAEQYPAFEGPMEVWAVMADGDVQKHAVAISGRETRWQLATGEEPQQVVVNPMNGMLAVLSYDPPLEMTLRQATDGPTAFARLQAIDRLGSSLDRRARDALVAILRDEKRHWGQRDEAAAALGRINSPEARDALLAVLADGIDEPRARRAAVDAVGRYRHPTVAAALIPLAREDASFGVEAAACAGLANQEPSEEIAAVLLEKASGQSWGHRVQQAAIAALADLGDTRGIEPAMKLGGYGGPFRARGTGIDALGKFYLVADDEQKRQIRQFLVDLTGDPQERHALGAIRSLGATGDEAAIAPLQRLADGGAPEGHRRAARDAIEQIRAGGSTSSIIANLRERLRRLEEERDAERAEPRGQGGDGPATRPAS
jgi:aminopeptidase N